MGAPVYSLSLRDPVYVRAYVAEPDLGKVAPGTAVELSTDSSAKRYHGQIGYVAPRAEFTPKSVETTDLRTDLVYRLRVVVSDADDGLRQGMPVTIRRPMRRASDPRRTDSGCGASQSAARREQALRRPRGADGRFAAAYRGGAPHRARRAGRRGQDDADPLMAATDAPTEGRYRGSWARHRGEPRRRPFRTRSATCRSASGSMRNSRSWRI